MKSSTKTKTTATRPPAPVRRPNPDDLATWADTGGDLSLWPSTWNQDSLGGALGSMNPHFVPPGLRPFYERSHSQDEKVLRDWPTGREEMAKDIEGHPCTLGRGVGLTWRDPETVTHWQALVVAQHRFHIAEQARREQMIDGQHTCQSCGQVDRVSVGRREVGAWQNNWKSRVGTPGPLLCSDCLGLLEVAVDDRRRERLAAAAAEVVGLGNGVTRGDAVRAFLERNSERIMGS